MIARGNSLRLLILTSLGLAVVRFPPSVFCLISDYAVDITHILKSVMGANHTYTREKPPRAVPGFSHRTCCVTSFCTYRVF